MTSKASFPVDRVSDRVEKMENKSQDSMELLRSKAAACNSVADPEILKGGFN